MNIAQLMAGFLFGKPPPVPKISTDNLERALAGVLHGIDQQQVARVAEQCRTRPAAGVSMENMARAAAQLPWQLQALRWLVSRSVDELELSQQAPKPPIPTETPEERLARAAVIVADLKAAGGPDLSGYEEFLMDGPDEAWIGVDMAKSLDETSAVLMPTQTQARRMAKRALVWPKYD